MQDYWNELENKLILVVDELVPLVSTKSKVTGWQQISVNIKNKINKRKRLLKSNANHPCNFRLTKIKTQNSEIKAYYKKEKLNRLEELSSQATRQAFGKLSRLPKMSTSMSFHPL